MMEKLTVKEVDGEKVAVATVNFNLGKVYVENNTLKEDGTTTVIVDMGMHGMEKFYEQLVFDKAVEGDWKGYKEALEQYVSVKVNKMIGIEQLPLKLQDDKVDGIVDIIRVVREDLEAE
ncbi:hypothetical protein ACIQ1D_18815 [Lysinibacillus xylanilyticus]|uniref:hypothetical protein n=1 Tax=Lysinibacillus xylanilyticus TaxID=582475 RepID=UPI0037F93E48